MPPSDIANLTDFSFIIARSIVKSIGCDSFLRIIVIFTFVPGSPRILDTASSRFIPDVGSFSIIIIVSPAFIPALYAGVSSIGEMTVRALSRMPIVIPNPPKEPFVPI